MTLLTLIPFLGAVFIALLPSPGTGQASSAPLSDRSPQTARWIGLAYMFGALAIAVVLALRYDSQAGGIQFKEFHHWIPSLGVDYFVGADGMSLMLILLTAIITPFAVLSAGPGISKLQVVLILLLETTLFGSFTALNFIHWFLYYELSLVPAFLLIRSAGTKAATTAALRFFIYTLLGGLAMLIGFLAIQLVTGTFDLISLAQLGPSLDGLLAARFGWPSAGLLVFCCIFLGLAVKVPVVPFHTWLPDAYAEAPSSVTMLLTGLMSKMGVYGFLRLLVPLFPQRMQELATPLLWLALATIIFSAFTALAQTDLKRIFAYSSVNHLGYCLLGIFAVAAAPMGAPAARAAATNGVLLQIFNHGLTAAALFCFVGFIERRSDGLRGMADFGGLRAAAPVFAGLMGIAIFSSLGLPGLNGFVGEFLIFSGTFNLVWWSAALAAIGLFVTAVFLLNIIQKVFTGPLPERWSKFPDLTSAEILTVAPAIALMFVLGICPQVLIALFQYEMILTATFLSAFAGAALILLLPERHAPLAKWVALVAAVTGLGFAKFAFLFYDNAPGAQHFQYLTRIPWIPQLGISFSTGADGISVVLLLLTGVIAVAGVLFSWNITHRPRAFFAFYLIIIGGVYGVFQSFDLFLLFVFYEIVIIPKYFLIAAWGSTNREYGAMKLTMYSVAGSALVLLALIATYAASGAHSFDLFTLADPAKAHFAPGFQAWAFPVMFIGFAVLAGLWPFHTWAPTGHVAAPTAVSMLLAGVVMKLGSYSALRVAMTLFPQGLDQWRILIAVLATAGIVLGALVALAQKDLKFTVGYSSIAHMGFVLLGLMTLNLAGLSGSVLQMFSHGIIGGLLFAVVGRMIYDRTHTRDIAELGKMNLAKTLPFAAFTFTVASVASMGLPGFSGFIAEFTILSGSWKSLPWLLLPAAIGVVVTVAFTLRALQRSFFPSGESSAPAHAFDPITLPEKLGALMLIATTLYAGLLPSALLDPILRSFHSPLMHGLLR